MPACGKDGTGGVVAQRQAVMAWTWCRTARSGGWEDKTTPVTTGGIDEGSAFDATVVPYVKDVVESSYHLLLWRAG